MKLQKTYAIILGLLLILFISNCKKQESPDPYGNKPQTNNPNTPANPYTPPAKTFSAPVAGYVVDENNNPVPNAIVSAGGKTFISDANGAFEFSSADFTGDFCYIKAVKKGYFTASNTVHGTSGDKFLTRLVMVEQKNMQTFTAAQGKNINVGNNAAISFPPNAIKTLNGKAYTGNVNVAAVHLNPEAANFSKLIPGGDLRGYSAEGTDVQLISYGMLNVELYDDAGNLLQLADGQKATLSFDVPPTMAASAPATIPLWYFDENKGVWIEEGEAKLQNGKYTGAVSHFTPWNIDWKGPRAYIKGKIKDCDGDAILGVTILAENQPAEISYDGSFNRWFPAGIEVNIYLLETESNKKTSLNIKVPKLAEGQVFDLGMITVPCQAKIKGHITNCADMPLNGFATLKTPSQTYRGVVNNGNIVIMGEANGEKGQLLVFSPSTGQLFSRDINLPSAAKTTDIGSIVACPSKTVTPVFSFDYNDGSTTKTITFTGITNAEANHNTALDLITAFYNTGGSSPSSASIGIWQPKKGPVPQNRLDSLQISIPGEGKMFIGNGGLTAEILKYEGQLGEFSGTFSGTMLLYDNTKTPPYGPVTITNGKFAVLRMLDK